MPPKTAARQASLSFTISQSLLKLVSIESVMPSNHLILFHSLSSCPQSFPTSGCFLMRWPKYWNFSFSISPFSGYSGMIRNSFLRAQTGDCFSSQLSILLRMDRKVHSTLLDWKSQVVMIHSCAFHRSRG